MKTEHRAHPRRHFLLFLLFPALVLATAGCNGSYGGGGGGGGNAPYITTQPVNQTVTAGQTAAFTVTATGTAPLSYQWQKSGSNISGATSSSYTTPTTTTADNGSTFDVVVSNSVGTVTSNAATLTVNAASGAPTITSQPANQTVTAGQTATFTVVASGTAPLSYQWQKNNSNISGATSASYTTPATTTSDSGATFKVVVSNSAGSTTSSAATLTVNPSSGSKWPIKVSSNGRYFTDASTPPNPWIMVGDSAHHIINVLPMSSWATYLSNRQLHGFNTVNIFSCSHGNCPSTGATADAQLPFTKMITSTCNGTPRMDYDLSFPNPAYWSELDSFINMAATYNLVVLFDPLTTADYMPDMRASGSTKVNGFGAFLGNRYKNFPNIIWELGNDFQTWTSAAVTCPATGSDTDNTLVKQLMAGIANADPNHILTIQLDYQRSYSNQDTGLDPYLKTDGFYTYYETYDYALKAYGSTPVTPVFLTEANLETANNTNALPSGATGQVLRYQMWWTMTSGAAGHIWGNEHVSHFDSISPTWQSQLDTVATTQVQYLTSLFSQFSWWNLAPDTTHKVVTAGFGTANANNLNLTTGTYATTTWDGGTLAIVYTPVATNTLSVNMANFTKAMNASWYDPTTGTSMPISGSPFANSGSQNFTPPNTAHADGTHDWVLVLQ